MSLFLFYFLSLSSNSLMTSQSEIDAVCLSRVSFEWLLSSRSWFLEVFSSSWCFFLHCIVFHSIFHLEHVNRMCLINIWSLSHLHVIIVTLSTRLSCRNWLKSIFLMRSCVSNALWDFTWSLCKRRCWWVISDIRYWKWTALNLFLHTTLHVYLICFCMNVSYIIISVRWCLISNRDNSCTSSVILSAASFLSTSACFVI